MAAPARRGAARPGRPGARVLTEAARVCAAAGRPDLAAELLRRRSFDEQVIEAERARAADEALAAAGLPVPRPRPPRLRAVP